MLSPRPPSLSLCASVVVWLDQTKRLMLNAQLHADANPKKMTPKVLAYYSRDVCCVCVCALSLSLCVCVCVCVQHCPHTRHCPPSPSPA